MLMQHTSGSSAAFRIMKAALFLLSIKLLLSVNSIFWRLAQFAYIKVAGQHSIAGVGSRGMLRVVGIG